jgi:hypothetical protein
MYHCCWQIEGAVIGLSADENDLFSWFQSTPPPAQALQIAPLGGQGKSMRC